MRHKILATALVLTTAALIGPQSIAMAQDDAKAKPERESKVPPAKNIGEPVNCIPLTNVRSTVVRDDSTIDFIMRNRKIYRNTLPNYCPRLGFERAFSYRLSITQLCNVDIITVLQNLGGAINAGASCGLGEFQQIELIKAGDKQMAPDADTDMDADIVTGGDAATASD